MMYDARRLNVLAVTAAMCLGAAAAGGEFPDAWYYHGGRGPQMDHLRALEGKPAPALSLGGWLGQPQDLPSLAGRVVVLDFWGTWCAPCRAALPKNVALMQKYGEAGLMVIGVHDASRGSERMSDVARSSGVNYPLAVDRGTSARAYRVGFWPTYAVIDQRGVVRAIGLQPDRVEDVVKALMGTAPATAPAPAPAGPAAEQPLVQERWLEGSQAARRRLDSIPAATPPPLHSTRWLNGPARTLESLAGSVVLLDFWATWCAPCKADVPKLNDLHRRYRERGLTVIGVCDKRGAEQMAAVVESHRIEFAVCEDTTGRLFQQYQVDGRPDYYLIDRHGRLRVADCRNDMVVEAVEALLAEAGPQAKAEPRPEPKHEPGPAGP
jgi:thiol-disulfide isomerase/thioredoxin